MDFTPSQLYLQAYPGLLYTGSNVGPSDHAAAGSAAARSIQPLDTNGLPNASGAIVMLSAGMSNAEMEWCDQQSSQFTCEPYALIDMAALNSKVNHTTLKILDGAHKNADAKTWVCATGKCASYPNQYDRVRDSVLTPAGFTELQVQTVWLKQADINPTISLPNAAADAFKLEGELGQIVRAIKIRWPNVKQIFLSSRIYAGYSTSTLNPEPYAYESGFAVKWLIQAQITQRRTHVIDPVAGDLLTAAPFIDWGPYIWGDGANNPPGSKALVWQATDFGTDGTHPNRLGISQVATALLNFFVASPMTPWFLAH